MATNLAEKRGWHFSFILIVSLAAVIMLLATLFDRPVTAYLADHQHKGFTEMMGRSLFEAELPGANDPLVLLLVASLVIYIGSWRRPKPGQASNRWIACRPHAGFILLCALAIAFLMMHGFKLSMGRARPGAVFDHEAAFSAWYTFGAYFIGNGPYSGAFPSGHTAQVFSAMAFAYVLIGDPLFGKPLRLAGWAWGMAILALSVTMGVARCMSSSHWLTDVAGSICLGWTAMHLIYHWLLFVPDQRRYFATHHALPPVPAAWELRLGGYLMLTTLGILLLVNGTRALLLARALWLIPGIVAGAALIYWSVKKIATTRNRVRRAIV